MEGEKYPILYEVEYLKDKVRLKTDFLKDGQQYNYEKEMEYDQFLLFLQTKNLQPTGNTQAEILKKSKKDKKIEYQKSPIRKWNRFSINSIKE
ncbi:hypothetical protein IJM86_04205 [bacterium]|nr:hypothetical protein [bacterium]